MTTARRAQWLLPLVCLALLSCESTLTDNTGECTKSTSKSYPTAGVHGSACTTASQCQYGVCSPNSIQMSGVSGSICTKDCSCGPGSQCSADDDPANGLAFVCAKVGPRSECALSCTSKDDAFCASKHSHLPYCVPNGAGKICAAQPAT